jgi:predicted transcriptional regulator
MSKQDVISAILKKLDSKQDRPFQIAMDELKHDGLIEIQEDGVTLILTQKGSERL